MDVRRSLLQRAVLTAMVTSLIAVADSGCRDRLPTTPDEVYLLLIKACDKEDPARLFDVLDTATQWSIESVHHAQREMHALIVETYPREEKARALARIPPAAEEEEEQPRRYYRRLETSPGVLQALTKRLHAGRGQPVGSVDHRQNTATVWREGGSVFQFARDAQGRWGFAELRQEWEQAKLRAVHDLETVRKNAALYRALKQRPATAVP